jgi:hypothetical protein
MPVDPTIAQKLTDFVTAINSNEQALSTASDASDAAQAAVQTATAAAAPALAAKNAAHDALSKSIDDLTAYIATLK